MDDKEKEKFGVIIDKNDQDTGNQPKVDEGVSKNENNIKSEGSHSEKSSISDEKQLEGDKANDVDQKNEEKKKKFKSYIFICIKTNKKEKSRNIT